MHRGQLKTNRPLPRIYTVTINLHLLYTYSVKKLYFYLQLNKTIMNTQQATAAIKANNGATLRLSDGQFQAVSIPKGFGAVSIKGFEKRYEDLDGAITHYLRWLYVDGEEYPHQYYQHLKDGQVFLGIWKSGKDWVFDLSIIRPLRDAIVTGILNEQEAIYVPELSDPELKLPEGQKIGTAYQRRTAAQIIAGDILKNI